MIVVHHLEDSRSQRILWLLEELELEYEIKHYARDAKTSLAPESLKRVHPLGRSPVITDGDTTVAESGAIIEYLVSIYGNGRLVPEAGTPERLKYTYWLHYAEGTLMPLLLLKLIFDRMSGPPVPLLIRPVSAMIAAGFKGRFIKPRIKENLDYLETELEQSTWFAGEQISAADVQMSFPLEAAVFRAGIDASRPQLLAFVQRIHARPAYQRALERGGPYAYGG